MFTKGTESEPYLIQPDLFWAASQQRLLSDRDKIVSIHDKLHFKFCYLMTLPESILYSVDYTMINEYGAVIGMRIGRGNRCTRRIPAPMPRCPPQIQHHLTWD
jgi:hypothetical protein